jgi:hypothetical protein
VKKFLLTFLIMPFAGALLPPFYQDVQEIEAILDSPDLKGYSAEQIVQISKEKIGYRLETTHYIFNVEVKAVPSSKIGPAEFKLHFHSPVEKN